MRKFSFTSSKLYNSVGLWCNSELQLYLFLCADCIYHAALIFELLALVFELSVSSFPGEQINSPRV